ncbi:histone-like nucleoid-structuring protein Lsr2 [Rhodococcus sp. IEGM 1354]|uniref:histone-like nucleoid-structuring protein Lsr2 n=1 Tax=Rhodococcus sp. IEGM 1354 TaxID=3047088 RepID=UPI0030142D86
MTTKLVDDTDGSVINAASGEPIELANNGIEYSIDLKAKNASGFHKEVRHHIEHSTRVGGRKRKPSTTFESHARVPVKRQPDQARAIRQWAFDQGCKISERGRITADIEEACNAAYWPESVGRPRPEETGGASAQPGPLMTVLSAAIGITTNNSAQWNSEATAIGSQARWAVDVASARILSMRR